MPKVKFVALVTGHIPGVSGVTKVCVDALRLTVNPWLYWEWIFSSLNRVVVDCKANTSPSPFAILATEGRWAEGFPDIVHLKGSFSKRGSQLLEGGCLSISRFKSEVLRLDQNHYTIISAKRFWTDTSEAIWLSDKWKQVYILPTPVNTFWVVSFDVWEKEQPHGRGSVMLRSNQGNWLSNFTNNTSHFLEFLRCTFKNPNLFMVIRKS